MRLFILLAVCLFLWGCFDKTNRKEHTIPPERIFLNKNSVVCDRQLSCTGLGDMIPGNNPVIVFRIPEKACSSCINREISVLKDFVQDNSPFKVAIVTQFKSRKDFLVFENYSSSSTLDIFNTADKLTALDTIGIPYYMLVDSNFKVLNAYIVKKEDGKSTSLYLENLIKTLPRSTLY